MGTREAEMAGRAGRPAWWAMAAALALAACGDDGGGADTKAGWEDQHGSLLASFRRDLDAAGDAVNRGERAVTLGACMQLAEDARELREEALPVPNPAVDAPLRRAVNAAVTGAEHCVAGARAAEGAHDVELAQKELPEARQALREADAAYTAWR
jgi:hypothetical protein